MATGNGVGARGHPGLLFRQVVHAYVRASHLKASLDQFGDGSRAIDAAAKSLYNKFSNDFDWFIQTVRRLLNYIEMDQYYLSTMIQKEYPDKLRWEAAIEVLTERLYAKAKDKSLLLIVYEKSELKHHEHPSYYAVIQHLAAQASSGLQDNARLPDEPLLDKQRVVLNFVEALLKKETASSQIKCCDENGQSPLHHAVKRGFKNVVSKLLEHNADPMQKDFSGKMPLHLALEREDDKLAAMIVKSMANKDVINLFLADKKKKDSKAQCSFQDIVNNKMTNTVLGVLDCTVDIDEDDQLVKLNYSLLESDGKGRSRKHKKFNSRDYTGFERIALSDNKEVACHGLVKRLTKKKWHKFAKTRFILKCCLFLLSVVFMTFAAVTGVDASNPKRYNSPVDYARAVSEGFVLFMVLIKAGGELYQMGRNRWYYLKDLYNYFDLASVFCLVAVVPLRYYDISAQWQVFGVGYLIWIFDVFKYAAITSKNYAYYQILLRMIRRVFPQFTVVFVIVLVAFSGSFLLALKGEDQLSYHDDTSSYHKVLFTGIRILIEGQKVVDYDGKDKSFTYLSTILMLAFMFVTIVMLLNILIAQLSDTYEKVQQNLEGGLFLTRMRIITKLEINSVFNKCCTKKSPKLTEKMDLDEWIKISTGSVFGDDEEDAKMKTIEERHASTEHDIGYIKDELSRLDKTLNKELKGLDETLKNVQTLLKEQSIALNQIQSTALIHRQSSSLALLPRSALLQSQRYSWRDLPTPQ